MSRIILLFLRRLWIALKAILRPFPILVLPVVLLTIIPAASIPLGLLINKYVINAITDYLASSRNPAQFALIVRFLGLEVGFGLCMLTIAWASGYLNARLSRRLQLHFEHAILAKCACLDYRAYEDPVLLNLIDRVQCHSTFSFTNVLPSLLNLIRSGVSALGAGVALWMFSPLLCFLALITGLPELITQWWLSNKSYELTVRRTQRVRREGCYSGQIVSPLGALDCRLLSLAEFFLSGWRNLRLTAINEDLKIENLTGFWRLGVGLFSKMANVAAFVYVIILSVRQDATIGSILMNVGLFGVAQGGIAMLAQATSQLYSSLIYTDDFAALMATRSRIEGSRGSKMLVAPIRSIRFNNVHFSYPGSTRKVFAGADFEMHQGERVCLVGENGSGKSTTIKLLLRLYDVDHGSITINGVDIREYDIATLRQSFGVMMQVFSRFPFSLKENVAFGDLARADDCDAVERCLALTGLKRVCDSLPNRSDTLLSRGFDDGEELSVGQWQRLALARTLFRDAPVLVLDEPTNALDSKIEAQVFAHIRQNIGQRIWIHVSHRLRDAQSADRIIVFDNKGVAESGTHESLIKKNGCYASLFRLQGDKLVVGCD